MRSVSTDDLAPDWRAAIHQGDILIIRDLPSLGDLLDVARGMIAEALAPHDPNHAHLALADGDYLDRIRALRTRFEESDAVRTLFGAIFSSLGMDSADTYRDRLMLRVVPPGPRRRERPVRALPPHRDSWGSNLYAQINWWAPITPLHPDRTMALYPAHWRRPIANTTADWDLHELLARRARGEKGYPTLPQASAQPDEAGMIRLLPVPGELVCFSGAHLHATLTNTTDRPRFSLETRTISASDLSAGMAAPNIDGSAPRTAAHWFQRLDDGRALALGTDQSP